MLSSQGGAGSTNARLGFHTVRGGIDTGTTVSVPSSLLLQMHGRIYGPGMGSYLPLVVLALRTPGWGFHTVLGGIDSGGAVLVPGLLEL